MSTDLKLTSSMGAIKNLLALPKSTGELDMEAKALSKVKSFYNTLTAEMRKVIIGQRDILDLIIMAILCNGHVLLEGVPGLGKTLIFRTLSKVINLNFRHVQFTPDLMPSDILGTEIVQQDPQTQQRVLKFLKGPIFCHFLLADEINRTSPKTQAALLQAMQDREVSIGNYTHKLEAPFFVVATQNPIDQEGVYPLPEAQLDRFMFNVYIDYPAYEDEVQIAHKYTQAETYEVEEVITREDILVLQTMVRGMLISDSLIRYVVSLVSATRLSPKNPYPFVEQWLAWGAGPRATLHMILAAKARALLKGKYCVSAEDIRAVAPSVLRHRIRLNFSAQAENMQPSDLIQRILEAVPEQKEGS